MQSRDALFDLVAREKPRRVIERVYTVDLDYRCPKMKILTSHLPNGPDRAGGRAIRSPLDDLSRGGGGGVKSNSADQGDILMFCRWSFTYVKFEI